MLVAPYDRIVDRTPVLQPHWSLHSQAPRPISVYVLREERRLALMVVRDQIQQPVAIPIGESRAGAPEEGRARIEGIGLVG